MTSLFDLVQRIRIDFLNEETSSYESDYMISSSSIANALNEAQKEMARRCLFIQDSSSAICSLPLTTVDGEYPQSLPLSSKIIRINYVLFPSIQGRYKELHRTTLDKINRQHQWSWIGKKGDVTRFMTDFETQKITFDHQPTIGGTVKIGVNRLPMVDLAWDGDGTGIFPEIQEHDLMLIHGALKQLYSKSDAELADKGKSDKYEKLFELDIQKLIPQEQAAMCPQETVCRAEVF